LLAKTREKLLLGAACFADDATLNPTEAAMAWDIESIACVRDAIQRCVVSKTGCTEQQFYPCFCEQQVDSSLHAV
jgi:hypothetical protein